MLQMHNLWPTQPEMSFRSRVAVFSFRGSLVFSEGLRVEPLLQCVERSRMRWLGDLMGLSPERLPGEEVRVCPTAWEETPGKT